MQGSKLFVGNLNYTVENADLEELFSKFGTVKDVKIVERRGFGFVEMSSQSEAEKAKEELNNTSFKGRNLNIDEAKPRRSGGKRDSRNQRNRW
ncbi:RNA recognition motif domain-containing protein [candidate division CSSED10-310 bacterium]|uniref:RNA recognition motif domain-containing protein n=1 Tax=candidate division CSSED10-310 bacterium TaxID=2855610 RepID=A0ABV6YWM8_UNCC1